MALFNYPKFKAFTTAGVPLAGGLLYTYEQGTTTPKTTYSDSALSVANTNPIVLDANGEANVYLSGYYKMVLKTSAGVTLWTLDNVAGIGSSVLDLTTIGDYNNDLAAAVAAIGSASTTLYINAAINVTDNLTVPSNIELVVQRPGTITITAGKTLTINGVFSAGKWTVFPGAGSVSFAANVVQEVRPEWTGGTGGIVITPAATGLVMTGGTSTPKTLTLGGDLTVPLSSDAVVGPFLAPVGGIMMWGTETAPTGWLHCNGASLARTGTYAGLFAVIGTMYGAADANHFNLPDLRGRFVRGWDNSHADDPDAASRTVPAATGATLTAGDHVGTEQADDYKAHTHKICAATNQTPSSTALNFGQSPATATEYSGVLLNAPATGGNETRPDNTALMFIIKY